MMNRREFLASAAAAQVFWASRLKADTAVTGAVPEVPPFDPSKLKPSDFSDADLDMPYNLTYLPRIANSIETEGPIAASSTSPFWRGAGPAPSLKRPHHGKHPHPRLVLRKPPSVEPVLRQPRSARPPRTRPSSTGATCKAPTASSASTAPQQWNLAATAFSVKFISEALRLLKSGPPITPALHARAIDCCRKALHATLYDPDLLSHGKSYSNQFTNIFAGGAAFLSMYPDATLWARLKEQVEASPTNLQSPCGYMYEHDGPDLGYTLNTHHENLQMAYHYWRGTHLGDILVEEENRFGKWLSYNIMPEPGQPFWVANRSIECRQQHAIFPAVDTPLADRCLILRAFATPPERRAEQIHAAREKMEKQWPQVDPLPVGEFSALSPYVFLQRAHYDWHPTAEQMAEARKLVRPLAQTSLRRADERHARTHRLHLHPPSRLLCSLRLRAQSHLGAAAPRSHLRLDALKGVLLQSQTRWH
jgi:hypothetical protein